MATTGRCHRAASPWTRRATSGSRPAGPADPLPGAGGGRGRGGAAATPPPTDAHVLKFSGDGKFLLQIGKPGETGDDTSTDVPSPPDRGRRRRRRQRGLRRRRHEQPPHRRLRRRHRQVQAALGCERLDALQRSRVREAVEGRTGVRLRSPQQSHPGVSEGWHVREGSGGGEGDERRRLGLERGLLERSEAAVPFRRRRREPEDLGAAARHARRCLQLWRRWPLAGPLLRREQRRARCAGNLYTGETYEGKRLQKFISKGMGRPAAKEQR